VQLPLGRLSLGFLEHPGVQSLSCFVAKRCRDSDFPCRYKTEDEREELLPVLRDMSRQEYLRKREDVKLVGCVLAHFCVYFPIRISMRLSSRSLLKMLTCALLHAYK